MQLDHFVIAFFAPLTPELALSLVSRRQLWPQDDRLDRFGHFLATGLLRLANVLLLCWLPTHGMLERFLLAFKQAFERVLQIEQQMEAIRHLLCLGSPFACALSIGACTVTGNHLDAGMSRQPLFEGLSLAIRQQLDNAVPLQIN